MEDIKTGIPARHSFKQSKIAHTVQSDKFGNKVIHAKPTNDLNIKPSIDPETGELKYDLSYEEGLERTLDTPQMRQFMASKGIEKVGNEFRKYDGPPVKEVVVESVELSNDLESLVDRFDNFDDLANGLSNGSIQARVQRSIIRQAVNPSYDASTYKEPAIYKVASSTDSDMAMFCAQCRYRFKGSEKFCPSCGEARLAI